MSENLNLWTVYLAGDASDSQSAALADSLLADSELARVVCEDAELDALLRQSAIRETEDADAFVNQVMSAIDAAD